MSSTMTARVPQLGVAVGAAATLSWIGDLLTRPPCPSGSNRLIDFELAAPIVSGFLTLACVAVAFAARGSMRRGVVLVLAVPLLVLVAYDMWGAFAMIASHRGAYDTCWSF